MTPLIEWLPLAEQQARYLVSSGFFGQDADTLSKAMVKQMKARELAVPTTYAMQHIIIVKGRLTMSAELMLATIQRDYGHQAIRVAESTAEKCVVEYRIPGWDGIQRYAWTWEMATRAGNTGGDNWRKYPDAMLRARCISAVARMAFPMSIGGMYTPEEAAEFDEPAMPLSRLADSEMGTPGPRPLTPATAELAEDDPEETKRFLNDAVDASAARPNRLEATERQQQIVSLIASQLMMTPEELVEFSTKEVGSPPNELDRSGVSSLITELQKLKQERRERAEQPKPADVKQKSMSRVHAAGADVGLDHDALHRYVSDELGFDSMTDMTTEELDALARNLKDNPQHIKDALRRIEVEAGQQEIPTVEAEPIDPDRTDATDDDLTFEVAFQDLIEQGKEYSPGDWYNLARLAGPDAEAWISLYQAVPDEAALGEMNQALGGFSGKRGEGPKVTSAMLKERNTAIQRVRKD